MTRFAGGRRARRVRQWLLRRARGGDGGFILLESIIAIAVITVVMGAVGAEFVSGLISTSQQRVQQTAVQLADSAMEQIRALHPSDLVTGRGSTSVTNQFNAASAAVQPWLAQMDAAVDSQATALSGPTAAIPTSPFTQKPGTVSYTLNEYLGWCSIRTTGSTACVPPSSLGGVSATPFLRAVISVAWSGTRCGTSACTYVTSTLISTVTDRTFRINTAPYTAPIVVAPGNQSNAVNDTVSLQLNVQNGTGVPPFTWAVTAGSLPAGLGLSPTGLISGTVGGSAATYNFTVQVTDAFLRTDTQSVTWTIKAALLLTDPGPQASTTTGASVNLALAATGGEGSPYTFTDPNSTLPPGLSMTSAGVITGRPTTVGTYTVQIKVGDGKRFTTGSFTWTVTTPPLAASNPGAQKSTLSAAISPLTLSASGGSGTYTWSDSPRTLPAGLTLSAGGVITGTPTATGASAVTLTVSDGTNTKSVSFTWTVLARPTVTAPPDQVSSAGTSVSLQVATTCPNSPCSYAFGGTVPGGLAISSSGLITGTVGATLRAFTGITVTVTDAAGGTVSSAGFTWTVSASIAFASALNNVGVTQNNATDVGNLDGNGNTYSKASLATAGATSGGRVSSNGVAFTWPLTAGTGNPDNILAAGQTITMSGTGTTLGFLVSSSYAATSGTGTITYTDSTTQPFTLADGNWRGPATGYTTALTTTRVNQPGNTSLTATNYVYYVGVALTAGKTVASVKLPNISASTGPTTAAMHIFAMSMVASSLASSFNNVGVTANTATANGNYDGNGDSFSKTALANAGANSGAAFTSNGVTFTWPATAGTGSADNTLAAGQTVAFNGSGTTLGFLVSGAYGSSSGTGVITYTDGSTQNFTLATQDWWGPSTGYTLALAAAYENVQGNTTTAHANDVFYVGIPLTVGKTIDTIQLPNISAPITSGVPSMHIFAIGTK